jgi:hypothetical protein
MKRALALIATSAVVLAAPMTVEAKKKPPPLKITFKSWQVVLNDSGHPINAANKSTFTYCPADGVTHIYAIGTAKPTTKGRTFSVTWRLNGEKLVTLGGYKVKKGGKVLAALHRKSAPLDDGTYTAARKNKNGITRISITLKADQAACS